MCSLAYSIEGLMAAMIAELVCVIRYKASQAPNLAQLRRCSTLWL
jgi:hypothetical protein